VFFPLQIYTNYERKKSHQNLQLSNFDSGRTWWRLFQKCELNLISTFFITWRISICSYLKHVKDNRISHMTERCSIFYFFFCQVEEPISSVNYEKVNIIKIKIHLLSLYTYTFVLLHGISDISTKLNYLILSLTLNIYYVDLLFFTILCLQLFKQKVMTSYL
jgi:uncharacterized protein (DUF486 family)